MQKKIYSLLVVVFAFGCLYLYSNIFLSSLRYENNKSLFNYKYIKHKDLPDFKLEIPDAPVFWVFRNILQNPAEVELYLRIGLLEGRGQTSSYVVQLQQLYEMLLETRPTWPYIYSGLIQVGQLQDVDNHQFIEDAIYYGKHETKVIKSLAEILFHEWISLDEKTKNQLLTMLSEQSDNKISKIVVIAAKFSRVFEYCDFIYEKKHVEYAACKSQYWQPLSRM